MRLYKIRAEKISSFLLNMYYTEQQKKRIFCIFGIVYKLGFKYWSNDM